MIKTISEPIEYRIIETDEVDYSTYRRSGPNSWENLMGNSWEEVYFCEEIEAEYQEFIVGSPANNANAG